MEENKIPTYFIYVLKDPKTKEVVYVGKTYSIKQRFYKHTCLKMQVTKNSPIAKWLTSLLLSGTKPIIESIEVVGENWEDREIYWIDFYRKLNLNLLNKSNGGKGYLGLIFTEEMKEKQRIHKISKPIKCINDSLNENLIIKSISQASRDLNLKKSNIIAFLKGRYNGVTYKGWKFEYH